MAKTNNGNKKVYVPAHTRQVNDKTVKVPEYYRSTPNKQDTPPSLEVFIVILIIFGME